MRLNGQTCLDDMMDEARQWTDEQDAKEYAADKARAEARYNHLMGWERRTMTTTISKFDAVRDKKTGEKGIAVGVGDRGVNVRYFDADGGFLKHYEYQDDLEVIAGEASAADVLRATKWSGAK